MPPASPLVFFFSVCLPPCVCPCPCACKLTLCSLFWGQGWEGVEDGGALSDW